MPVYNMLPQSGGGLQPIGWTLNQNITSNFPSQPTSGSRNTYTFTEDEWCFISADRGSASGYTLFVSIDGQEAFVFPAYNAWACASFVFPVKAGQVMRIYTDNGGTTWNLREVRIMK